MAKCSKRAGVKTGRAETGRAKTGGLTVTQKTLKGMPKTVRASVLAARKTVSDPKRRAKILAAHRAAVAYDSKISDILDFPKPPTDAEMIFNILNPEFTCIVDGVAPV